MARMARGSDKLAGGAGRGREYWRSVVEQWRGSGLGQAEFCRRHEIARGTLGFWKYALSQEARSSSPRPPQGTQCQAGGPVLLPVRITKAAPVVGPGSTDRIGEIEIVTPEGRLVRVRGRVDRQWLAEVLSAVESVGC